jgi:G3E family GTPase
MADLPIPIPVTILTGFLGAGKTTFLNELIRYKTLMGLRVLVIENEYGQECIDSQLVIGATGGLFELSNGCLCCDLNEELFELLSALWERRSEFDELVIETTGIADPAQVAVPFLTNPSIAGAYRLTRVVGLVDARKIEFQLEETEEARQQISFSDVLLVVKTEELVEERLTRVTGLLKNLNPFARVLTGNMSGGYPIEVIDAYRRYEYPEQRLHGLTREGSNGHMHDRPDKHTHDHSHDHHRHHDIVSLSFRFPEPFDLEELEWRLMMFLRAQSKDLYRLKGIIYGHGQKNKIILQSVSEYLAMTEGEPWGADEERISRIVFIGKRLKPEGFEKFLRHCFYTKTDKRDRIY